MFARIQNAQTYAVSLIGAFVFAAVMISAAVPVVPIV